MDIRPAREGDFDALLSLLCAVEAAREHGRAPDEVRARLTSALPRALSASHTHVYVAEDRDHSLLGYGVVHIAPFLILAGPEGYVSELFVHPLARGRGVGALLMNALSDAATKAGCSRLGLLNDREIESYQRGFYAKHGWSERAEMANFTLKLETTHT